MALVFYHRHLDSMLQKLNKYFLIRSYITDDHKEKPAIVQQKETHVEALGTSISKSVQDVVIRDGGHVVKDVALTISQATEPVEKGVTNIHEKFQHISLGPQNELEPKVEIDEHITEDIAQGEQGEDHVVSSEMKVEAKN